MNIKSHISCLWYAAVCLAQVSGLSFPFYIFLSVSFSHGYISIIRGNYSERPSSSILIFCSQPLRGWWRLNPGLCPVMEMILWGYIREVGIIRVHHQSKRWENSLQLWLQGRHNSPRLHWLTDWLTYAYIYIYINV